MPGLYDVLIIGGGPAGLSAATALARQIHSAVVFDNSVYRNAVHAHMHNVAGWDHQDPKVFRQKAREDLLTRYKSVEIENTTVDKMQKLDNGHFEATDDQGRSLEGESRHSGDWGEEHVPRHPWVRRNLGPGHVSWRADILLADADENRFHCLYCSGYEEAGLPSSGILAIDFAADATKSVALSRMARRLTKEVTLYTHGNLDLAEQIRAELAKDKDARDGLVRVDSRAIKSLESGPEYPSQVILAFEDGEKSTEGFLVRPK